MGDRLRLWGLWKLTSLRWWLIRKIAGGDTVALNLDIVDGRAWFGDGFFIENVRYSFTERDNILHLIRSSGQA